MFLGLRARGNMPEALMRSFKRGRDLSISESISRLTLAVSEMISLVAQWVELAARQLSEFAAILRIFVDTELSVLAEVIAEI